MKLLYNNLLWSIIQSLLPQIYILLKATLLEISQLRSIGHTKLTPGGGTHLNNVWPCIGVGTFLRDVHVHCTVISVPPMHLIKSTFSSHTTAHAPWYQWHKYTVGQKWLHQSLISVCQYCIMQHLQVNWARALVLLITRRREGRIYTIVYFLFSGEAIVLDITAEFCRQLGEEEEGGLW